MIVSTEVVIIHTSPFQGTLKKDRHSNIQTSNISWNKNYRL